MGDPAIHLQTIASWQCFSFFLSKESRLFLSRMLMPCKSTSQDEFTGSLLLLWWVLLGKSIRVLNHRQNGRWMGWRVKTSPLVLLCFFISGHKRRFLLAERETFARFVVGRRSGRHKEGSILSRLEGEFTINACSGADATIEKLHTSIKMSACGFLWIQPPSIFLRLS